MKIGDLVLGDKHWLDECLIPLKGLILFKTKNHIYLTYECEHHVNRFLPEELIKIN